MTGTQRFFWPSQKQSALLMVLYHLFILLEFLANTWLSLFLQMLLYSKLSGSDNRRCVMRLEIQFHLLPLVFYLVSSCAVCYFHFFISLFCFRWLLEPLLLVWISGLLHVRLWLNVYWECVMLLKSRCNNLTLVSWLYVFILDKCIWVFKLNLHHIFIGFSMCSTGLAQLIGAELYQTGLSQGWKQWVPF